MEAEQTTESTPKKWWPRFFDALRSTGIVSAAAQAAGVDRSLVYRYKREVPVFAAQWEEAEHEAIGLLEDIATKRAAAASDTLLIFLLKTRARAKYGDVVRQEINLALDDARHTLHGKLAGLAERASAPGIPGQPD